MISVMSPANRLMEGLPDSRGALHWAVATALAGATTFVLTSLNANSATAGMVYLALVVWSATQAGIILSLYLALLCALAFDYYFLPPYHTLRLATAGQWVEMLTFLACCVLVSRVAERARKQTEQDVYKRQA